MNTHKYVQYGITALILFAIVAGVAGYVVYQKIGVFQPQSSATTTATLPEVKAAYSAIDTKLSYAPGDATLQASLQTLRDIAADANNSPLDRVRALNGINYGYTQSNYDAGSIRDIVFSSPPFAQFYIAPTASSTDPLHPEGGTDVAAVEAGLAKLNAISNSLVPNHYAITRLEAANMFAYQRAVVAATSSAAKEALQKQYGETEKELIAAYDALPPLKSVQDQYSPPMLLQMLFCHASALAFTGGALRDKTYTKGGESAFINALKIADKYSTSTPNYGAIFDEAMLTRIFYASYYWKYYKTSDPDRIKDVLRPVVTDSRVKTTALYTDFLPTHKTAKVAPYIVLRDIASQMPELKAFLEGLGWKF